MQQWIDQNQSLLGGLFVLSVIVLVLSALAAPAIILRIPADYFAHDQRPPSRWAKRHRAIRLLLTVGRNALGVMLILAGVAMLVLPGQGLLTIAVGFFLIDFPRKYRFQKWLVGRPKVLRAINWYRRRRGVPPLEIGANRP